MKKKITLKNKPGFVTAPQERIAYCLFFLGQNIIWGLVSSNVSTFITDIGIASLSAAGIMLIPKLWDALNDVLFGYLLDRHVFKNGQKFLPWVRIGTAAVGITTVALFLIPPTAGSSVKVAWFMIAYLLFDVCYTVLDAPAFAVTTVMTPDVPERTSIIAGGKLWSMVGGVVATLAIGPLQKRLGWGGVAIVVAMVSVVLMVPMLFSVKERRRPEAAAQENPSFREMLHYLKSNKYLIVALIAMVILGLSSVEQEMALRLCRICLKDQDASLYVSAGAAVSVIAVSAVVPTLSKKWDKFHIMCVGLAFAIVMNILNYFVGYSNFYLTIVMTALKCSGLGFWQVIVYMLVADTVEYGHYKSGTRAAGITFSLQTLASKLKTALIGSMILVGLSAFGFVEGENAVQPAGVEEGIWAMYSWIPAVGFSVALVLLLVFYKLRSKDVQLMSLYNRGELSREDAEALLAERYGPAGA